MTQQEIDAFLAIVEQGSVTGAAESLFLTQSTLSNRLRVLEEELGTQLFRRGRGQRRIELTEAGERFIPLAEKWRLLWRETASFSAQQRLDFVAISSVNTYIMPQVLRRMGELSHISMCTYHTMEAYTQVESGQAEIGLVPSTRYSRYVEATHIFTEPYSLICDRDSPLTGPVHPSQLPPDKELLVNWHLGFMQWHYFWFGLTSSPVLYTDDMQVMQQFLGRKGLWAVMPQSAAHHAVRSLPVKSLPLEQPPEGRTMYLLRRWGHTLSPEAEGLVDALRQWCRDEGLEYLG